MYPFQRFFTRTLLTGLGALFLFSCDPDKDEPTPATTNTGDTVFILNEGNFRAADASVSLFTKSTSTVADLNYFRTGTGRNLGDVAQSMTIAGDKAYIVVNNSNKVEVVSLPGFGPIRTIEDLSQPRYMVAVGDKGYVTEWTTSGTGRVSVLNLTSNTVTKTIPVGTNPEQLLLANGKVYVANANSNTISVINPTTDAVESTITVEDGPSSLVQDQAGNIWVLCTGFTRYGSSPPYPVLSSTPGNLIKFSPATPSTQTKLAFTGRPGGLLRSSAGDQLYYRYQQGVYRMSTTAATLPTTPLIARSFYGLNIDPADNTIYAAIASFTGPSKMIRYRTTGTAIDSFSTNIGTRDFLFY